jgi:hypothetical protein
MANEELSAAFIRLGFNADAAAMLADVNKENLDIASLQFFDEKGVKILCATLRKPGGLVAGIAPPGGGPVPMYPNPGVYVSAKAEMNLAAACFMARHYKRTNRTLSTEELTVDKVQQFAEWKEAEDDYKEPDVALKLTKPEKIIDFIDEWPEHLALYNGQNARPLSYVIRDEVTPPDDEEDPVFGEPETVYASLRDEVAARADHNAAQFRIDNARVFELLNDAVTEHKHVKTWIKPFATKRDGRGAWIAFKAHYRGSSEMEAIETAAEHRLETTIYRGEKPRYNFEKHASMHRKAHLELEKATGQTINEATKVRRLTKSIQVSTLLVPLATIKAQEDLRKSFDLTVNFLKAFIASPDNEMRNVSEVDTKKKGDKTNKRGKKKYEKKGGGSNDKTLDRYYKKDEWWKLDSATREKIIAARKKRNVSEVASSNAGKKDDNDSGSDEVSTSQRKKSKKRIS